MMFNNEDAVAAGAIMFAVALIVGAVVWLVIAVVANGVIVGYLNPQIEDGNISQQTRNSASLHMNIISYMPPAILIFWGFWTVHRAKVMSKGG